VLPEDLFGELMAHFARSLEGHFFEGPGLSLGVTAKGVQRSLPMSQRSTASGTLQPMASGLIRIGESPLAAEGSKGFDSYGPTGNLRYSARDMLFSHGLQVHAPPMGPVGNKPFGSTKAPPLTPPGGGYAARAPVKDTWSPHAIEMGAMESVRSGSDWHIRSPKDWLPVASAKHHPQLALPMRPAHLLHRDYLGRR